MPHRRIIGLSGDISQVHSQEVSREAVIRLLAKLVARVHLKNKAKTGVSPKGTIKMHREAPSDEDHQTRQETTNGGA